MKSKSILLLVTVLSARLAAPLCADPLGAAFTYQGRLNDGGTLATGNYDLLFTLNDAVTNGNPIGASLTNASVAVSNGLFTLTLDFGSGAFDGSARWLEIGVRTNGSSSDFAVLAPRQIVTAVPYALQAVGFSGPVADGQLSANVPRLGSDLTFSGSVQFSNASGNFIGN